MRNFSCWIACILISFSSVAAVLAQSEAATNYDATTAMQENYAEGIDDIALPREMNEGEENALELQKNKTVAPLKLEIISNKRIAGWKSIVFNENNSNVMQKLTNAYPWIEFDEEVFIEGIEETRNTRTLKIFENAIFKQLEFQFDDEEKLYLIRMKLNPRFFSFLDLVRSLQKKYGKEDVITARKLTWIGNEGVVELYRDLSLKYIRKDIVFPEILKRITKESELEEAKKSLMTNIIDGL